MTPDELFTRLYRQRAELAAVELAIDALMQALPADVQEKWIEALKALQAMRTQAVQQAGAAPEDVQRSNDAIENRLIRLAFAASNAPKN